jgi:hypothetical protein
MPIRLPVRHLVVVAISMLALPAGAAAQAEFTTTDLRLRLDARGTVISLWDVANARERLAPGEPAPLLSIRAAGRTQAPATMAFNPRTGIVTLDFRPGGVKVGVRATAKPTHLVFEVVSVEPADAVEAVVWGPYPTTVGATVGEIVGVVREGTFALGLQVLNLKTRGGALLNDEGSDPSRGTLAQPARFGSVLQAFALDRTKPRTVAGWNGQFPGMPVPPMAGETVVGSKVALFASPADRALERIGVIEVAEGAPHPMIDGVWAKQWGDQGRSYLIAAFSESTVDELLAYTKRADLMTLYHPEPFATWGHYGLDPKAFPTGDEGMRRAVEKGRALGIRIGVHTLTNFINTNDAYVSPVPDPRLARTGSSPLAADVDAAATEIRVASPAYFANEKANWLHTVVIDRELIRYRSVSASEPWTLLGCERGAFGTTASPHRAGTAVGKLVDHPYKVFFPTIDLQDEIARNLAKWFNKTGVGQLDFDGREGCLASGQGDYAQDRFVQVFYDNLDHAVVNGTSTSSPYYWHTNSYCNWGEPWYGGFRESMQEYRIQNQALFDRNFVPNMLGWYRLTSTTSLAEMEWMLARAAGYGAGFAMSTTLEALRQNPDTPLLLDTIREWEAARRSGAFTPSQRERARNPRLEFHLERVQAGWQIFPFHDVGPFRHAQAERQPGEPASTTWAVDNADAAQPLQFRIQVSGAGSISKVHLDVGRAQSVDLAVTLAAGESLVFDASGLARVYDAKGRQKGVTRLDRPAPMLAAGRQEVSFDCAFAGDTPPVVDVTFRTRGTAEPVMPPTPTAAGRRDTSRRR